VASSSRRALAQLLLQHTDGATRTLKATLANFRHHKMVGERSPEKPCQSPPGRPLAPDLNPMVPDDPGDDSIREP
jgi:hypothetical protein